jgi:hypothetical protein
MAKRWSRRLAFSYSSSSDKDSTQSGNEDLAAELHVIVADENAAKSKRVEARKDAEAKKDAEAEKAADAKKAAGAKKIVDTKKDARSKKAAEAKDSVRRLPKMRTLPRRWGKWWEWGWGGWCRGGEKWHRWSKVHMFLTHRSASNEVTPYSRLETMLTDEQVSILQKQIAKFQAVNSRTRSSIVKSSVDRIERTWGEAVNFDREEVLKVCIHLTKLGPSHIFVACSAVPLQQV